MSLRFDLANIETTEFGVAKEDGDGQSFVAVPVDDYVQHALREMAEATWAAMRRDRDGPVPYEPSEKHGATEYLELDLKDELAVSVRQLHEADNLDVDSDALDDPGAIFCYFARFADNKDRHLTAVRRATQFKGILKSRNRLVRMLDDTLQIIEDRVFKLDNDFDFLADDRAVHILRPSGFEFAGRLQAAILAAVPVNAKAIAKDLKFVEFSNIAKYAAKHPRAARYLASIQSQGEVKNIDKTLLKKLCQQTDVEVSVKNGKVRISPGHEMGFLEILDRRRYEVSLIKDAPERYRAASRTKLGG